MQISTGARISAARKAAGLSQQGLAAKISEGEVKVGQAQVSNWERNDPEPHMRWVRRIALACDVPVSDLVDLSLESDALAEEQDPAPE